MGGGEVAGGASPGASSFENRYRIRNFSEASKKQVYHDTLFSFSKAPKYQIVGWRWEGGEVVGGASPAIIVRLFHLWCIIILFTLTTCI